MFEQYQNRSIQRLKLNPFQALLALPLALQNVLDVLRAVTIDAALVVRIIARRAHRHVQVLVKLVVKHRAATVVV